MSAPGSDPTETLISRASGGDDAAISALLNRHLPALRAFIRLRMGPRVRRWETDSDVVQSVCLEVLKNLRDFTYRGEATFRHWLFTAAQFKVAEKERYYRAEKRDPARLQGRAVDFATDHAEVALEICRAVGTPSEHAIGQETLKRIEAALDRLSEPAREVVLLSRLAGLSNQEIAEATGRTKSAVTSLL
ncbi:MAG: sigma-70 family RNA polymerase sigma factor, partial [Polyangiaceae bacterium]|nr:sigma-70 family RNA polymerase sigma factor [Polyangiaceae bacterium]